jgi:hypothetical protein
MNTPTGKQIALERHPFHGNIYCTILCGMGWGEVRFMIAVNVLISDFFQFLSQKSAIVIKNIKSNPFSFFH